MVNFIIFSNGVNTFLIQNAPTSQQESNSFQVEDQIRVCAHVSLLSPDYHEGVPGRTPAKVYIMSFQLMAIGLQWFLLTVWTVFFSKWRITEGLQSVASLQASECKKQCFLCQTHIVCLMFVCFYVMWCETFSNTKWKCILDFTSYLNIEIALPRHYVDHHVLNKCEINMW